MTRAIYGLFFLSGLIGLVYESIWSRYLKLILGHSSFGQILTICIFMGGLSLGALLAGKLSTRMKRPFLWYAAIEAGIGIGGLVFHDLYTGLAHILYQLPALPPAVTLGIKLTALTGITLPFAMLMGMTFSVIALALTRQLKDQGNRTFPMLYFANSLGAACGALLTSYLLVVYCGTQLAIQLAGVGNLIIAAVFYQLDKRETASNTNREYASTAPATTGFDGWSRILLIISFITGLSSFFYEVSWIRILGMLLGSSVHSFDIVLSAFILGLAVGSLTVRKWMTSKPEQVLGRIQVAMGIAALVSLLMIPVIFQILDSLNIILIRNSLSYGVYSVIRYGLALLLMFPASFFAGMTLPLITNTILKHTDLEAAVGYVYGWNTAGAILGTLLACMICFPVLGLTGTLILGALLDIGIGLWLLSRGAQTCQFRWAIGITCGGAVDHLCHAAASSETG